MAQTKRDPMRIRKGPNDDDILKYLLSDVFHHLELSTRGVDLVNGAGLDLVDKLAEDGAVLEYIFKDLAGRELGSEDALDPGLCFLLLFRVALGSELMGQFKVLD